MRAQSYFNSVRTSLANSTLSRGDPSALAQHTRRLQPAALPEQPGIRAPAAGAAAGAPRGSRGPGRPKGACSAQPPAVTPGPHRGGRSGPGTPRLLPAAQSGLRIPTALPPKRREQRGRFPSPPLLPPLRRAARKPAGGEAGAARLHVEAGDSPGAELGPEQRQQPGLCGGPGRWLGPSSITSSSGSRGRRCPGSSGRLLHGAALPRPRARRLRARSDGGRALRRRHPAEGRDEPSHWDSGTLLLGQPPSPALCPSRGRPREGHGSCWGVGSELSWC